MKIFLIGHDNLDYGCYSDFVIVANDENEVREMAKKMAANEGTEPWETANITTEGEYIGDNKEPFCLLASFHAGQMGYNGLYMA